jgi:hypothetical protein
MAEGPRNLCAFDGNEVYGEPYRTTISHYEGCVFHDEECLAQQIEFDLADGSLIDLEWDTEADKAEVARVRAAHSL